MTYDMLCFSTKVFLLTWSCFSFGSFCFSFSNFVLRLTVVEQLASSNSFLQADIVIWDAMVEEQWWGSSGGGWVGEGGGGGRRVRPETPFNVQRDSASTWR